MYLIQQTEVFTKWLHKLKDIKAKVTIVRRIERAKNGNFGDFKSLGSEVYELRITTGPGYRVYYTIKGGKLVLLLVGGDKSTQAKDIEKAKKIKEEQEDE